MHFDQNSDVPDWYTDTWCAIQVLIPCLFSMEEITEKKQMETGLEEHLFK